MEKTTNFVYAFPLLHREFLEELFKLRAKFLYIWTKIGPRLCQKYNMTFVTDNTPQAPSEPFHYIMMLEASGGMGGKRWQDLLDGVEKFLKIRTDYGLVDRITIIVYDSSARYAYLGADIKSIAIRQIPFTNGGTNFASAFDLVIQTMQRTSFSTSTSNSATNLDYIIIFMSDGPADFPSNQLETLLTMKAKINQFWTVAHGKTGIDVRKEINKKMDGTFKQIEDSADFTAVYAEIARY